MCWVFVSNLVEEKIIIEFKELDNFTSDLSYNYEPMKTKPISPAQDTSNLSTYYLILSFTKEPLGHILSITLI